MFIQLNKRRGQSTLEYGVLIAIVAGALIAIQLYLKRSMEGKSKKAADEIGDQYDAEHSAITTVTHVESNSVTQVIGGVQPRTISNASTTRNQSVDESIDSATE